MAQLRQGLEAYQTTGAQLGWSGQLALLAEVYGQAGQVAEGLNVLGEVLGAAHDSGEHYQEAELYRLQGELLLFQSACLAQAEACFQHAVAIARRQQAKSWELRAAMSLARLWQQQGKCTEARALLTPVYEWFTEGFDTADLQTAGALLDELA